MAFKGITNLILNRKQSRLVSLFILVMTLLFLVINAVSINGNIYKTRTCTVALESASGIACEVKKNLEVIR